MKGQTAVEYLMTYGWAILIILIVAGVLAYYGIFNPQSFVGASATGFTTVQIFQPWSLSAGGVLIGNVENRVGSDIEVTNVFIWSNTDDTKTGSAAVSTADSTFSPGEKKLLTFDAIAAVGGTAGNTFDYSVAIEYTYGTTSFNSTGSIRGTFS